MDPFKIYCSLDVTKHFVESGADLSCEDLEPVDALISRCSKLLSRGSVSNSGLAVNCFMAFVK